MKNINMPLPLLLALGLALPSFSQTAPGIQWQNTIGGNQNDALFYVEQTTDGGYVLGGNSFSNVSGDKTENSNGLSDFWVVKLDAAGSVLWQNTIGGNGDDYLYSMSSTSDGGYILGGLTASDSSGDKTEPSMGGVDYWIVKLDSLGGIQWQNTIGGSLGDYLYSITETSDGGFFLVGASDSDISGDKTENAIGSVDIWVVKTDALGGVLWQNTIGGTFDEVPLPSMQTSDGGYILGGFSDSNISGDKTENCIGVYDFWLVKLDSTGAVLWDNTIGGTNDDELYALDETSDGGFILAGTSNSNLSGDKTENSRGFYDYWIVKTDALGVIQWQNTVGGNQYDDPYAIRQTPDGGYIVGGPSDSNISGDKTENSNGSNDYWIVKLDSLGGITWQNSIGGSGDDRLLALDLTSDNGFFLGGFSWSGISGDKTENSNGISDYWVLKLYPDTITSTLNIQPAKINVQVFPNPADKEITLESFDAGEKLVQVFNSAGQLVRQISTADDSVTFDTVDLSDGIYSIRVSIERSVGHTTFVVKHH